MLADLWLSCRNFGSPVMTRAISHLLWTLALLWVSGCQSVPMRPPVATVAQVDLERFMGEWYVYAHIPTFLEKNSYAATESYRLSSDGTIATTFAFREGGFDGKEKKYTPTGFVRDPVTKSTWGMRFLWPFKAEYLIAHVDQGYSQAIIARNKRDFVWILTRSPTLSADEYRMLLERVSALGYDMSKIRQVPQQPR
jgi:apolipoprotein D and lipocalin family protein